MGCVPSTAHAQGSEEVRRASARIDAELRRAREEARQEVKMLLLGAGESGKSTLVKQMRLIYREPFSDVELEAFRAVVFANAIQSMQVVLRGFDDLEIPLPPSLQSLSSFILSLDDEQLEQHSRFLHPQIGEAIRLLWQDPSTREVVRQSNRLQLNDSASYFFDEMPRIGSAGYVPSDQDILRTRVRSMGIVEERFKLEGYVLRVFDVGGQRSERKKWIHCFENVQVLVFVVALNEYDQTLWEDETINRLDEAMMLFESIANSRWFEKSAFILLLNKIDLFKAKLKVSPLSLYFSDYTGNDSLSAGRYLSEKFSSLDRKKDRGRPYYCHFTCATDTAQVKVVIGAVMDSVIHGLLSEVGLM